jgi:uncharacterized protein (DUF2384 family)
MNKKKKKKKICARIDEPSQEIDRPIAGGNVTWCISFESHASTSTPQSRTSIDNSAGRCGWCQATMCNSVHAWDRAAHSQQHRDRQAPAAHRCPTQRHRTTNGRQDEPRPRSTSMRIARVCTISQLSAECFDHYQKGRDWAQQREARRARQRGQQGSRMTSRFSVSVGTVNMRIRSQKNIDNFFPVALSGVHERRRSTPARQRRIDVNHTC